MYARAEPGAQPEQIPPLENGDRLTREEFHRRYLASPHIKRAELVEGVVYVASPVSNAHAEPDQDFTGWLALYKARTPGVRGSVNGTVILDGDNEVQPDGHLRFEDGRCKVGDDGYLHGGPELVVEVAKSSTSYDLHQKKKAYRRNGVREYVVFKVREREVCWFGLEDGKFVAREADDDGVLRSRVFPGLWLHAAAMADGDLATVLDTLQRGLDSPEHAEFVATLASPR